MTHVLGKVDKLVAKSFQHRGNVHTQYLNHGPWSPSLLLQDTKSISLAYTAAVVTRDRRMAFPGMLSPIYKTMGLNHRFQ